jgi:DnaJ-class molecular chaperone
MPRRRPYGGSRASQVRPQVSWCPDCKGKGGNEKCLKCHGKGVIHALVIR